MCGAQCGRPLSTLTTVARLAGAGGARSVIAESVLVKHQLLILNRSRKRPVRLEFIVRPPLALNEIPAVGDPMHIVQLGMDNKARPTRRGTI